jgi:hypothetical protein
MFRCSLSLYIKKYWLLNYCACYIQIEEVRLRLNLDVTVSSDSPAAPGPIESFNDMVFSLNLTDYFIILLIFILGMN